MRDAVRYVSQPTEPSVFNLPVDSIMLRLYDAVSRFFQIPSDRSRYSESARSPQELRRRKRCQETTCCFTDQNRQVEANLSATVDPTQGGF